MPVSLAAFLFPLTVTLLRCGGAIAQVVERAVRGEAVRCGGGPAQLAAIGLVTVVTTFSVPGNSGGSIIMMVPCFSQRDCRRREWGCCWAWIRFRTCWTTTNVTGDVVTTLILARRVRGDEKELKNRTEQQNRGQSQTTAE